MRAPTALVVVAGLSCCSVPAAVTHVVHGPTLVTGPGGVPYVWRMPARAECGRALQEMPVDVGALTDDELVESSGLVASPTHKGVLWLHNDSGDQARLFATRIDGAALGRLILPVPAVDIEDIAAAPCPDLGGPCLYVADVGNNLGLRQDQVVYAVPEPDVEATAPMGDVTAQRLWRFPVRVPGAPADIEAMVVYPDATHIVFFEKADEDARVLDYPSPWQEGVPTTLQETARFDPPGPRVPILRRVTAADVHPAGNRLLLRTYGGLYEYEFGEGQDVLHLDAVVPRVLSEGEVGERQGEAAAYDEDGTGVWTISEGAEAPLHHYACE